MTMKNLLLLMTFLSVLGQSNAQVGINTKNPQGVFHIDGRSSAATTNPDTGPPSAVQQLDDFLVNIKGEVGVGTTNPQAKLHIEDGATVAAPKTVLKIVDGNQAKDRVLTVVDAAGNAQWKDLPSSFKLGQVYGTTVLPGQTFTGYKLITGFSFKAPVAGYYSFEIRWWGEYLFTGNTQPGLETATHFYLLKNGVLTDEYEAYSSINVIDREKKTVFVPLYSTATVNDVFTIYARPGYSPGTQANGRGVEINSDPRSWLRSKVTVTLMDL